MLATYYPVMLDSDGRPVAFHDLPASSYPFTVEVWQVGAHVSDGPLWTDHVTGPCVMEVPGFGALGIRVYSVIHWPDGTMSEGGR